MNSDNSQQSSLVPLTPQTGIDQDTDERFSPEAVASFRQSPERFPDTHNHPTHHYSQARDDWGGSEAVGDLLGQHGIDPDGLTVTVFGGFTGEFAGSLRELGCEVIFTDPMQEWVERAADNRFEAHRYAAEEIPADLVSRSDAFASFECYYPLQTSVSYSLYTALRMLAAPHGIWFAESPRTREVRQDSGAGEVALDIIDILSEQIELEWEYADAENLRLYHFDQPARYRHQSELWAEVLSETYQLGSPDHSTSIGPNEIQTIADRMQTAPHIVETWLDASRVVYRIGLGGMAEFIPFEQLEIANQEYELVF